MMYTTKALGIAIPTLAAFGIVASVVSGPDPGEHLATIPAGTTLVAVLEGQVSTARSRAGDEVELRTIEPLRLRNGIEIHAGLVIHGTVTDAKRGDRLTGPPEIGLRFSEIEIDGDEQAISTDQYRFGTLVTHARSGQLVLPVGQRLKIRLSRPLIIEYHQVEQRQEQVTQ